MFASFGPRPSYPAPVPSSHKNFNQLNFFLFKVQSLWSCAHYFQWFTGYLNQAELLIWHVATCFRETASLFNMHLSCFVDFILCPTNKYMFKVYKKARLICWMCSKLKIYTPWHSSTVFIVDFDHSQHINYRFSTFNFEQVFVSRVRKKVIVFWKHKKRYVFRKKSCKAYFIQWFIIEPNWNKLWTNDHAYKHNMNICFSSKFALGIPSVLSFRPVFWSALSLLFPRDLIFFCCIKPKTYLNNWNSETNW